MAARKTKRKLVTAFPTSKVVELLWRADAIMLMPPRSEFTERYPGSGELRYRFVLPLEMARTANSMRHAKAWQMAEHRNLVLAAMRDQTLMQWNRATMSARPLRCESRPMLRAIRFSSVQPDSTAAWWKEPVDVLLPSRMRNGKRVSGLGLIVDDRPSKLETREWWEQVGAGDGFALLELWTGG